MSCLGGLEQFVIIPVPGMQTGGYHAMINGGVPLRYSGDTNAVRPFVYQNEDIPFSILASRFLPDGAITEAWIISRGNMRECLESAFGRGICAGKPGNTEA
jgi:hypothetical protein